MEIWDEIKASFREGSVITRLIYLNLAVFVLVRVVQVLFFLSARDFTLLQWFELPSDPALLLRRPWTLVTYMFLHFDFLHILFNLLVLYWFGRIFLDYFDQNQLLGLYLLGGVAGGAVYVAAYNFFPVFSRVVSNSFLLGASASIIAILMAGAFRDPNRPVYLFLIGRVSLKYLALFLFISYIIGISTSNAGGNLAHLGGAATGIFFVVQHRRGRDITRWAGTLSHGLANLFKPRRHVKVAFKQPPRDDHEYNRQRAAHQTEINRILDKISQSGYDSLTRDEKKTLFQQGKNH